jgi:HAD superfamily hydrolase (TIGR01509 family)
MLPDLLIFDMDGLIFDTERLFMNLRADIMAEYGYVHREEDYLRTLGTSGENLNRILYETYGPEYPADEISKRTREAQISQIRTCGPPLRPGIRKLLSWAEGKRIPCCVATSTATSYAEEFLDLAGISGCFSFVIGGEAVLHSKPDPEIFLLACTKASVAPERALVLEDSENGVLAADRANIPVICIPDLKQPSPEIAKKAAAVCDSAFDVPDVLTAALPD